MPSNSKVRFPNINNVFLSPLLFYYFWQVGQRFSIPVLNALRVINSNDVGNIIMFI